MKCQVENEEKRHPGNREPEKEAHGLKSTGLMKRTEKFVGGLFICVQHSSSARGARIRGDSRGSTGILNYKTSEG